MACLRELLSMNSQSYHQVTVLGFKRLLILPGAWGSWSRWTTKTNPPPASSWSFVEKAITGSHGSSWQYREEEELARKDMTVRGMGCGAWKPRGQLRSVQSSHSGKMEREETKPLITLSIPWLLSSVCREQILFEMYRTWCFLPWRFPCFILGHVECFLEWRKPSAYRVWRLEEELPGALEVQQRTNDHALYMIFFNFFLYVY